MCPASQRGQASYQTNAGMVQPRPQTLHRYVVYIGFVPSMYTPSCTQPLSSRFAANDNCIFQPLQLTFSTYHIIDINYDWLPWHTSWRTQETDKNYHSTCSYTRSLSTFFLTSDMNLKTSQILYLFFFLYIYGPAPLTQINAVAHSDFPETT